MPAKSNRKNIEQSVAGLAKNIIEDFGLEMWNVEFYKDGGEYILEITLDKPGGVVSLDDCERVTRAVNPLLDEADPIEQSYSLVVSSPGVGRELKTEAHARAYINKLVSVSLFAKRDGLPKSFDAVLKSCADGRFELEPDGGVIILEKKEIARLCAAD